MHQAGPLCHVASVWRLFLGYLFALPENLITISPINSTSFAKSQTFSLFTIFFLLLPIVPSYNEGGNEAETIELEIHCIFCI